SGEAAGLRKDVEEALSAITVSLPPLAGRPADLAPLARGFLRVYGGPDAPRLTESAERALSSHAWPGNVRELERVVQTALLLAPAGLKALDGTAIEAALLARQVAPPNEVAAPGAPPADPPGADPAELPDGPSERAALKARLLEVEAAELRSAIRTARG